MLGVDRRGVIRFVNHQMEFLFGFDRDDLVGTPLETLVPESVRGGFSRCPGFGGPVADGASARGVDRAPAHQGAA
jgi:PAS domain-containing protein